MSFYTQEVTERAPILGKGRHTTVSVADFPKDGDEWKSVTDNWVSANSGVTSSQD